MNAGIELLFWYSFGGLIGSIWLVYEVCQYCKRQEEGKYLPPPRCDLIARGGRDHWVVGEAHDKA